MLIEFIKYLLLIIVGVVGVYVVSRIVSYAFAKSWYQVKNQQTKNGGLNNGKETNTKKD